MNTKKFLKLIVLVLFFSFASLSVQKNVFAIAKVSILPYKIISSNYERYAYIGKSVPLILSSNIAGKKIAVIRNSDIASYIEKTHANFSSSSLLNLSKHFNSKYVIYGRIEKIGNVFIIQTNIFDSAKRQVIFRNHISALGVNFIVDDINELSAVIKKEIESNEYAVQSSVSPVHPTVPAVSAVSPTFSNQARAKSSIFIKRFAQNNEGMTKSVSKKYVIQAITAGRFLKNGIQTAVATRHRVILYGLSLNGNLKKLAQYNLSVRSNVIYLGIYNISKNYNAIVLTKAKLGMIISYMLIYRNGKLVKLTKNYGIFLRVMNMPGLGRVIVGQKPISVVPSGRYFNDYVTGQNYYPIGQFGGNTYIYKFNKSTNSLTKSTMLTFFNDITLYGTVYGNFKQNGKKYLVALSKSGNLMIINGNGKTIYTGSKTYGGSPLQVRVPSFSGVESSSYTGGLIYNIPAQISGFNIQKKPEIIVLKNYKQGAFLHHLNYFIKTSIFCVAWNKIGFYPIWEIKPVVGYSAGFSVFKENGATYLADAIVENPGTPFKSPKSYIAIYNISGSNAKN
ncbi:MAG: hypothetical protein M0Z57_03585 [Deltaproteobacteria bacterium]|jgi:hypothetical protein|uniref:Uncharacterized protein n=1 Tax=Candidatus Acidulodesulfobacterium acidiphilum TaxID=2597224 RepID=A0A520XG41_9DELT|nr:hypothetical protein [Deltaproteobacteria bacterium]MDA8299068.1 hypothetical protein [Deltaproteobacteria bacterium]RZV40065.1 MAG: hypothetical protein EVJ48_02535 [Candidatus Acidulodesulfobacterium acidiphilum]